MTFRATVALLGALLLASCNQSGTGNSIPATPSNISGDYTGTVIDSVGGTLPATAILAQHGTSAGGSLSTTSGANTQISALSLIISSSNALNGTIVQDLPSGATCTFSTTATYTTSSQQIAGSYTAVTGCSGQHGTYTLAQQCTDTVTNADKRPAFGVPAC